MHNINEENTDERIFLEVLGDMFFFYLILDVKNKIDNIENKNYINEFLMILAPIYCHEIIKFIENKIPIQAEELFKKDVLKFINNQRQKTLKKVIAKSKDREQFLKEMGIDYNNLVYDINIVLNNDNLLSFNFEDRVNRVNDYNLWNDMFNMPKKVIEVILSELIGEEKEKEFFENLNKLSIGISKKINDKFNIKRYSYSTYRLFQTSSYLNEVERVFILYRFRLISSVLIMSEFFKGITIAIDESMTYSSEYFFRKYKSLVIVIIGNEMNELKNNNSNFTDSCFHFFNNEVDSSFYSLNRALRNNLHYSKINYFNPQEEDLIDTYQNLYLDFLVQKIKSLLTIKVDKQCIRMTGFVKAFKRKGMTIEQIEKHYMYYYIMYLLTGKILL